MKVRAKQRSDMTNLRKKNPIQPHWWLKTFAGAVLGFTLAFALSGIFAWIGPGGISAPHKVQLVMWLIAPLWLLLFCASYFFRTGLQAFLCLLLGNLVAYLLLFAVNGVLSSL